MSTFDVGYMPGNEVYGGFHIRWSRMAEGDFIIWIEYGDGSWSQKIVSDVSEIEPAIRWARNKIDARLNPS